MRPRTSKPLCWSHNARKTIQPLSEGGLSDLHLLAAFAVARYGTFPLSVVQSAGMRASARGMLGNIHSLRYGKLSLLLAFPILDAGGVHPQHHQVGCVDALLEPDIEVRRPVGLEARPVADNLGLALHGDEQPVTGQQARLNRERQRHP